MTLISADLKQRWRNLSLGAKIALPFGLIMVAPLFVLVYPINAVIEWLDIG